MCLTENNAKKGYQYGGPSGIMSKSKWSNALRWPEAYPSENTTYRNVSGIHGFQQWRGKNLSFQSSTTVNSLTVGREI